MLPHHVKKSERGVTVKLGIRADTWPGLTPMQEFEKAALGGSTYVNVCAFHSKKWQGIDKEAKCSGIWGWSPCPSQHGRCIRHAPQIPKSMPAPWI